MPEEHGGSSEPTDQEEGYLVRAETVRVERRQGPLPDAEEWGRYEQVLPGTADRLLVLAESEVSHRHRMERWGQLAGALLPAFFVCLGAGVFLYSNSWAGVALAGIGLTPAGYGFLRDIASRGR